MSTDDFFFQLGRKARAGLRQGRWVWSSLTGSEEQALTAEYQAGCDLAQAFDAETPLDPDGARGEQLAAIGERLAERLTDKRRRWRILVTAAPEPNALALPGGFVYVSRGLVELCRGDEDEIACVLGHEMGHVVRGHAMERLTNEVLGSAATRAAQAARATSAPVGLLSRWILETGVTLLGRAYSRDRELEADAFGARLAVAAGYDPRGAIRAFERLQALADDDGPPLSEYFATHPPLEERIARLGGLIRVRSS